MNNRKERSSSTLGAGPDLSQLSDSEILFCLQIKYSYTLPEVAFLYHQLYQLAVRKYYQNVMKSIMKRRHRRTRKGRVEAVSRKVQQALDKAEHEAKKEREKRVCILARCFVKFVQDFVLASVENGFKDFQVT